MHFEQFLAVCRASILAEALRIGAQFSSKPRAKRGVSVRRTRTPLDRLQPTTNSDKLIDTDKHNTPLKRFAQERRTTDTDDSLPLCFLPHTPRIYAMMSASMSRSALGKEHSYETPPSVSSVLWRAR